MTIRLPAKLDFFDLLIEDISDSIERSVVEHDFPNRDGAVLEDMGAKAREIKFKVWFYDDQYEAHQAFLDYITTTTGNLYTLFHPVYGPIRGSIKSVTAHNPAEYLAAVSIDITFVQQLQPNYFTGPLLGNSPDVACEDLFTSGVAGQVLRAADDCANSIGDLSEMSVVFTQTLLSQFIDAAGPALWAIDEMDATIAAINGCLPQIALDVDAVGGLADFPATAPGMILSAMTNAVARIEASTRAVASAPSRYILALCAAYAQWAATFTDTDNFPWNTHALQIAAQSAAVYAGRAFDADAQIAKQSMTLAAEAVFDDSGNYLGAPDPQPFMSIDDLEKSLAAMRALIQLAVNAGRTNAALKPMALALLQHVNNVRIGFDQVVQAVVGRPMPLHLLCLQRGLPYRLAPRVLDLNPSIKNPSFTTGTVSIYA